MKIKDSALNEKYAANFLLYMYKNKESTIHISDPKGIVANDYHMVRKTAFRLKRDGLIKIKKQTSPKRVYTLSLTVKGEAIAQLLLEIELVLLGEKPPDIKKEREKQIRPAD